VDSRDVDAIEDTNIALQRENAELRAELGRMAVAFRTVLDISDRATIPWMDARALIAKWLPKQEAADD
jgi:hypothetical protein